VGAACPAHIIVETYSRECNVNFRTISQRLTAPVHRLLEGSQFFVVELSGVGTVCLAHIIVETNS